MCGLPPGEQCVIPRQNKDVCKDCDKATWQHIQTGVYFKWCKGCKKFLRLGSFSQKLVSGGWIALFLLPFVPVHPPDDDDDAI